MLLKRIYDHSGDTPKLDHVKVLRAKEGAQNFSTRFVQNGQADGLVSVSDGQITLHTQPELTFDIVRVPGYYCCYCNQPMSDGAAARAHIAEEHDGESPDSNNPAGYRKDNFYACERAG